MPADDSLEKSLMLGRIKGKGEEGIRRWLLLGRKAMANLDSVLKRKDITQLTKVCIVKAVVLPVVTYSCESWTFKNAECQKLMPLYCGAGEDS